MVRTFHTDWSALPCMDPACWLASSSHTKPFVGTFQLAITGLHHAQVLHLLYVPLMSFMTSSMVRLGCSGLVTELVQGMHHACMIPMHVDTAVSSALIRPACFAVISSLSSDRTSAQATIQSFLEHINTFLMDWTSDDSRCYLTTDHPYRDLPSLLCHQTAL